MEYGLVVGWWALLVAIAAAGAPIAAIVLRALPDRGAGLALPLALVVVFLPIHWLGHFRFGPAVVALAVLGLVAGSVAAVRRNVEIRRDRFVEWTVVFTLAYLLLIAVRAVDPAVVPTGGEKFLDYGLLVSLLRSPSLPPADVWFAGQSVQYYYGGHLVAATLATLTGTAAKHAYNLALAGFYGALVGAAYAVAGSIGAASGHSYRRSGALGGFFVGLASNAAPLLQAALWALPVRAAEPVAEAVAERTALPVQSLVQPEAFSYWTASRVIPGTINEFPLFAFLNGDLHAHMTSTPFLLLVVGVGLAYFLTPRGDRRRRRLLVFGVVPPVAGTLVVVNTWSFPTAAGLTGLAVLFASAHPRDLLPRQVGARVPTGPGVGGELGRLAAAAAVALAVAGLGAIWAFPFVVGPATGATGRSVGLLPDRSGLLGFLLVHGWFLLVFGLDRLAGSWPPGDRARVGAVAAGLAVAVGLIADAAAIAVVLPLLGLAWYRLRRARRPGFDGVLFVAGAGLVVAVEVVYLAEQAGPGRFNTVFKTYMQVWVLWGTGAGAAVVGAISRARAIGPRPGRIATGLAVLLVAAASIYGVVALGGHFADPPEPSLDATSHARTYHAEEWAAIEFLDGRAGQPTIASAPACWCNPVESVRPYEWANAPSTFTGVPTVAGWSHEVGYRGRAPYRERVEALRRLYTGSADERLAVLRTYDVAYVYVGPNERALYGDTPVGDTPGLSVAFRNEAVTIYAVNTSTAV